jgi:hypothetical protein
MMRLTYTSVATAAAAAATLALAWTACRSAAPAPESAGRSAAYTLTFSSTWTPATHPLDFPKAGVLTGPHFSGLIGASHNGVFSLFKEGAPPSPGLERLSEEGKHSPLDDEIRAAVAAGRAGALFETDPIRDLTQPATARVVVDEDHSRVSVVAMIAPSPDWFAGAADIDLRDGGRWVEGKEVTVYAWDSGGDDGTTYEAADADANPKHPTMLNAAPHFAQDGRRVPVGRLTLRRM